MSLRLLTAVSAFAALALLASGCGTATEQAGSVPESAKLAPRDAIAYMSFLSDEGSDQWKNADRLLALFPGARESLVGELESELEADGLTWSEDVAPALGPEIALVVTGDRGFVALTQPDDEQALAALLQASDEPSVTDTVSGWTVVAEKQAHIDAYRRALSRGSLDEVATFEEAMSSLPEESLAVGWVDVNAVGEEIAAAIGGAVSSEDVGPVDLAAAVSAEDDGMLVSLGVRLPDGTGDTTYEPKLFDRVPADAVAVLSFGGTQGVLDRVERTIDLDSVSGALDDVLGVSLDGVLDALSGEGVVYVRRGEGDGRLPEVTVVLDPPDADRTWRTIENAAQKAATEGGGRIEAGSQAGRPVNRLVLEQATIVYARIDETLLVSTNPRAVEALLAGGPRLADDDGFERAAERVGLGDRTSGFAYVDLDGLVALIEELGGGEVPPEAREVLEELESVILQASADGERGRLQGFVQTSG
jgi:hypothetical protein